MDILLVGGLKVLSMNFTSGTVPNLASAFLNSSLNVYKQSVKSCRNVHQHALCIIIVGSADDPFWSSVLPQSCVFWHADLRPGGCG